MSWEWGAALVACALAGYAIAEAQRAKRHAEEVRRRLESHALNPVAHYLPATGMHGNTTCSATDNLAVASPDVARASDVREARIDIIRLLQLARVLGYKLEKAESFRWVKIKKGEAA